MRGEALLCCFADLACVDLVGRDAFFFDKLLNLVASVSTQSYEYWTVSLRCVDVQCLMSLRLARSRMAEQ